MKSEGLFPVTWRGLRHPENGKTRSGTTTAVELDETRWHKIIRKHVCDWAEPWSDVIPASDVGVFRLSLNGLVGEATVIEAVARALDTFERQIAASLNRPLVVLYDCLRTDRRPARAGRRWLLVTPCGAYASIWAENSGNSLKTYYFSGAVSCEVQHNRWREAIRQNVQEYAKFDTATRRFALPALDHGVAKGDPPEYRHRIRFVTPASWGFEGDTINSPWRPVGPGVWRAGSEGLGSGPVHSPTMSTTGPGKKAEGSSDA